LKRRYNLALDCAQTVEQLERIGVERDSFSMSRVLDSQEILLEAALEVFDDPEVQERLLVDHLERVTAFEEYLHVRADARDAQFRASIHKVTAEIRLLKLRRQMQASQTKPSCWIKPTCRTK
jgi:phosphohistidine phosphatase SixA